MPGHQADPHARPRSQTSGQPSRIAAPLRLLQHRAAAGLRGQLRWVPRWYDRLRPPPHIADWSVPLLADGDGSPPTGRPSLAIAAVCS